MGVAYVLNGKTVSTCFYWVVSLGLKVCVSVQKWRISNTFSQNNTNMTKTCNRRYARLFCALIRLQREEEHPLTFSLILHVCLYPLQKTPESLIIIFWWKD